MWPYWIIFIIPACIALRQPSLIFNSNSLAWKTQHWLLFVLLSLMIGLRHEVGGDWINYVRNLDLIAFHTADDLFDQILKGHEPMYELLSWLGSHGFGGIYFVDTVCGVLFVWGLLAFCAQQSRPGLALTVAIPYLVTVVAMGYTRQGVAIGLVMLGFVELHKTRIWRFLLCVAFAAMFHKSAVVLMPIAVFANNSNKFRWLTVLGAILCSYVCYVFLLKESVNSMVENYIGTEYSSGGAGIRIAMNAFPAVIFLVFKSRFVRMTTEQRDFWAWMAWGAIGFIILLALSPSSTAVDRVALYWIPLQLLVWSQLPDAFGTSPQNCMYWTVAVIIYSSIILFSWLVFGTYSSWWIPYRFYPWEVLWQST